MLVNYVEPFGTIKLEQFRIGGAGTKTRPIDVERAFYKKHRDHLVHGTYREDYLRKHFRGPFPEIAFKIHELKLLPRKTLTTLAHGMTIHAGIDDSNNALVKRIQGRLRECFDR
jgi:hypothetical protein